MEVSELVSLVEKHLTEDQALPLGIAKPPYSPGVYALYFEGIRVYVGVARGAKGLRNRKRNYVGGDDNHTTHREFLAVLPNKRERSEYIKNHVKMVWFETETAVIAEDLEKRLIARLNPPWNRLGKTAS